MITAWEPGLLLRINDYKFEDDGSKRDKYAIILSVNDEEAWLIHSLTTSQNKLNFPATHYGCQVHHHTPYYFIPKDTIIGDQGFSFDKDTFIFFRNNVRKVSLDKFKKAAVSIFQMAPLGKLSADELKRLLKCMLKSSFLEQGIAEELSRVKSQLG